MKSHSFQHSVNKFGINKINLKTTSTKYYSTNIIVK